MQNKVREVWVVACCFGMEKMRGRVVGEQTSSGFSYFVLSYTSRLLFWWDFRGPWVRTCMRLSCAERPMAPAPFAVTRWSKDGSSYPARPARTHLVEGVVIICMRERKRCLLTQASRDPNAGELGMLARRTVMRRRDYLVVVYQECIFIQNVIRRVSIYLFCLTLIPIFNPHRPLSHLQIIVKSLYLALHL